MSDTNAKPQPPPPISIEAFLRDVPPNVTRMISSVVPDGIYLFCPALSLYCQHCKGFMNFEPDSSGIQKPEEGKMVHRYLHFQCRNCKQDVYTFAVQLWKAGLRQGQIAAMKYGQNPPFGPHIPARIRQLIGPDQELFNNALASESRGLGIGAFTYYRRIVDNQWQRLLSEIIKVAEKTDPTVVAALNKAKEESQFERAVKLVKDAIPQSVRIQQNNPLTLLYNALSEGLHAQTDAECLEIAQDIRLVLGELADRIATALKDHAELNKAVGRLANVGNRNKAKAEPAQAAESSPAPQPR